MAGPENSIWVAKLLLKHFFCPVQESLDIVVGVRSGLKFYTIHYLFLRNPVGKQKKEMIERTHHTHSSNTVLNMIRHSVFNHRSLAST